MSCIHLKDDDLRKWFDKLPKDATLLFDCDGVLWNGNVLYPSVREGLDVLRKHGCRFGFVTNNATSSRKGYEEKFARLGLDWIKEDMIMTSGSASAAWIKKLLSSLPKDKRGIYLIGQPGIEEELAAEGLEWQGGSKDDHFLPYQDFSSIKGDPSVSIVLHAFDMHYNLLRPTPIVGYHCSSEEGSTKYAKAYNYLKSNPDCKLILTNADEGFLNGDVYLPGEGRLASIITGASKEPHTVIGKPEMPLIEMIKEKWKPIDPKKTFFFGDNLEIDIPFANKGDFTSIFCQTGVSKEEALGHLPEEDHPDYILSSVGDFAKLA